MRLETSTDRLTGGYNELRRMAMCYCTTNPGRETGVDQFVPANALPSSPRHPLPSTASSLVVSMSAVTHGAVAHTIGKFRAEVKHERELHWCPPNKSNRMKEGYEASAACGDYIGGLTLGTGSTE